MIDREIEAKKQLVAFARKKAERNGTTLEAKVENWLMRYINEPDDSNKVQVVDPSPLYRSASKTMITARGSLLIRMAQLAAHAVVATHEVRHTSDY